MKILLHRTTLLRDQQKIVKLDRRCKTAVPLRNIKTDKGKNFHNPILRASPKSRNEKAEMTFYNITKLQRGCGGGQQTITIGEPAKLWRITRPSIVI